MKLPTIVTALLVSGLACADKYPASAVFTKQAQIIQQMNGLYPDVDVDVRWLPCDVENSWYNIRTQTILLCTEFEAYPGAAIFVAAHEMAHAIEMQRTDTSSEQDADELGALALVKFGWMKELLEASLWWKQQPEQGRTGEEHPANGFRAWELSCIAAGSEKNGPAECVTLYQGLRVRWNARLAPEYTEMSED